MVINKARFIRRAVMAQDPPPQSIDYDNIYGG
jgi:hypothetical protein